MKVYALQHTDPKLHKIRGGFFGVASCYEQYESLLTNEVIKVEDHDKKLDLSLLENPLLTGDKLWLKSFLEGRVPYLGKVLELHMYAPEEIKIVEVDLSTI